MVKVSYSTWDKYFKDTITWGAFRTSATRAGVPFKWVPNKQGSYNVHKEYDLDAVEKSMTYMIRATKHLNNQKMFLPKWQKVLDRVKELRDAVPTSPDSKS